MVKWEWNEIEQLREFSDDEDCGVCYTCSKS